jgi:hypothetical protein
MVEHELAIKRLYEVFVDAFPACRELWKRLVDEEQHHADLLVSLQSTSPHQTLEVLSRFKAPPIRVSIGFVEEQTAKARDGRLGLVEALSLARDLESALLESHFGKLALAAPIEIQPVLMEIAQDTDRHQQEIAEALAAEKQRRR